MIKYYGAGVLHNVIDRAIQTYGSLGYSTDMPLEAMYRCGARGTHLRRPRRGAPPDRGAPRVADYRAAEVPTEHLPTRAAAARVKFADVLEFLEAENA